MKKINQVVEKNKKEAVGVLKIADQINPRIELIQALIPLGLEAVNDLLQEEVKCLTAERYQRMNRVPGRVRWGKQSSSVYLADQKLSLLAPRVRDRIMKKEIPLTSLDCLQSPRKMDEGLFKKILKGLSCRDYEGCAEAVPEAFGLSASTVSRRYICASARKLKELLERRLDSHEMVAVFLDGKTFAEDQMVIGVGITLSGKKVILGFVQTATENESVCSSFLQDLVARGLKYEEGLLVVIDGSKGLRKAVEKIFGEKAFVQRCQWHKRENIVKYLPVSQQAPMRRKLQEAYEQPSYDEAKSALLKIRGELKLMNLSAVTSLEEGFEETLTLHRLGLFKELGVSLKTTNCLESINAQLGQRTDKVDRWRNSDQKQRWVAAALLDIEKSLRGIKGYSHLPRLKDTFKRSLEHQAAGKMKAAA